MLTRTATLLALMLAVSLTACADFSYVEIMKMAVGSPAGMSVVGGSVTFKYFVKGQKFMTTDGNGHTIIDFDAQTVTTFNNARRTYKVVKFSDLVASDLKANVPPDIRLTGRKKIVNGFTANEIVVTTNETVDMTSLVGPGRGSPALKMQRELEIWVASDVPGSGEMREFYERNARDFPWRAIVGFSNTGLELVEAEVQRRLSAMNGIAVQRIIRTKQAPGTEMQQTGDKQAGENRTGTTAGAGLTGVIEMTLDASGFSSAPVPESVFAVPDGYMKQ